MVMSSEFPKRDLWRRLPKDTPRGRYFEALREAVTEFYLADPSNPYQQAGRSSGAERWQETRGCFMEALHHDGDFMDIGCANGLLLETLISWAAEIGIRVRPHGLDFVPELIELARNRFPNGRRFLFRWVMLSIGLRLVDMTSSEPIWSMFLRQIGQSSSVANLRLLLRADD